MAYIASDLVGAQPLDTTDTVQRHPLGYIVRGIDATYGMGEFIYLKGVASTVVGDVVVYDEAFATTRAVAASRGPAAVAMSANVASQYGWYQRRGVATVKAGTVVADAQVQTSATAGTVDDTTTANQKIDGARFMTADGTPSAGFALAMIDNPYANGNTGS